MEPVAGPGVVPAVERAAGVSPLFGIGFGDGADAGRSASVWTAPPAEVTSRATGAATSRATGAATSGDAGEAAAALVDAVGAVVGAGERRVAASLVVLGYAARLVGPGLAAMLREGVLLDLRPGNVRYRYDRDRGFALSAVTPAGWRGPLDVQLARWRADVVDAHLAGLVAAVRATVPVSARLLWGNVASGLAGALRTLARDGGVPPARCRDAGLALLGEGPLAGTGRLVLDGGDLRFTRRSCCLYYRLPGGGTCGDCPLPATPRRG